MPTATGTVYALIDPRDGVPRYIGETTRPLTVRLRGHLGQRTSPKVRAWVAELKAVGLRPGIVPMREGVPAGDLLVAEAAEITRIIASGGSLLNEQVTALGRQLLEERQRTAREAAEHAGWAELAAAAMATFGGPLPPGDLSGFEIPDESWEVMSNVKPGHAERMRSLLDGSLRREGWEERYALYDRIRRLHETAGKRLWQRAESAWWPVRDLADETLNFHMERRFEAATETVFLGREDASRYLSLTVWYLVAVDPWRHLAQIAGLPLDDTSFIAWAGQDAAVRRGLEFLAGHGEGSLARLAVDWEGVASRWHEGAPGRLLGTVAAAYTGKRPAEAIRYRMTEILRRLSGVTFMDASGIGVLLGTRSQAVAGGGSLTLRSPSKAVRKLIRTLGLDEVLPVPRS